MKKPTGKKLMAVLAAVAICCGLSNVAVFAAGPADAPDSGIVSPQNVAITATDNNLTLGWFGKLTCYGYTSVQYGYKAEVVVELQQNNGSWNTIKTWSSTGGTAAEVDEDYYVEGGYAYRLKLTHRAYDANWNQLESFVKYSDTVYN